MSKAVKVKLNGNGIRQFLRSDPVQQLVEEHAAAVAARAQGEYQTRTIKAGTRYIATVEAADMETRRENYKNNTLLKALR